MPRPDAISARALSRKASGTSSSGKVRLGLNSLSPTSVAAVRPVPKPSWSCTEVAGAIQSRWCKKFGPRRSLPPDSPRVLPDRDADQLIRPLGRHQASSAARLCGGCGTARRRQARLPVCPLRERFTADGAGPRWQCNVRTLRSKRLGQACEGADQIRTGVRGFAGLCLTSRPRRREGHRSPRFRGQPVGYCESMARSKLDELGKQAARAALVRRISERSERRRGVALAARS